MKKLCKIATMLVCLFVENQVHAQGSPKDNAEQKLHRASLPSQVMQTLPGGAVATITYSQPALKGRVMGKDIEPKAGQVWRTGANEATVFEVSKDVMIEGQKLPAGKYGLYAISGEKEWTIIVNKTWDTWGAFSYKEAEDVLRVKAKLRKSCVYMERMVFTIDTQGKVSLLWGDMMVDFEVK